MKDGEVTRVSWEETGAEDRERKQHDQRSGYWEAETGCQPGLFLGLEQCDACLPPHPSPTSCKGLFVMHSILVNHSVMENMFFLRMWQNTNMLAI